MQKIKDIVKSLKAGGVGVIPTDTIYGIVCSVSNKTAVERIYQLRRRSPNKPSIILISSLEDLNEFNIVLTDQTKRFLKKVWPNPVSVVLPCLNKELEYLHRGTNTLAFRIPSNKFLQKLLKLSGPLIAPSANFEGQKPAETIEEAFNYFKENLDFYINGGKIKGQPSTVVEIKDNQIRVLRQGVVKVNPSLL
ncbi:threonylcarbamoyl-AMP synthase [Candidatus Daviesbacteria bacterium]|nr:threonylcarbamoyl-AMP synthase [Candidatus Daviesbacteria bacterium]